MLCLPNHTKLSQVQSDATNYASGAVLIQEGHPVTFENLDLNETEQHYNVQEKEMIAIVHCLPTQRHYLIGPWFVVKTNSISNNYFQSQKKISAKQARWQDFLAEFDFVLEHKSRRANIVVDALSQNVELAALKVQEVENITCCMSDFLDHI